MAKLLDKLAKLKLLDKLPKFGKSPPTSGAKPSEPPLPRRPMKYPYTYTAKIAQFPYKFYFKHNWIARYYFAGVLVSMPAFIWISGKANTPENKAKWVLIRNPPHEEHEHEHDD